MAEARKRSCLPSLMASIAPDSTVSYSQLFLTLSSAQTSSGVSKSRSHMAARRSPCFASAGAEASCTGDSAAAVSLAMPSLPSPWDGECVLWPVGLDLFTRVNNAYFTRARMNWVSSFIGLAPDTERRGGVGSVRTRVRTYTLSLDDA